MCIRQTCWVSYECLFVITAHVKFVLEVTLLATVDEFLAPAFPIHSLHPTYITQPSPPKVFLFWSASRSQDFLGVYILCRSAVWLSDDRHMIPGFPEGTVSILHDVIWINIFLLGYKPVY